MTKTINTVKIDSSIKLLRQYIAATDAEPLIAILEVLKTEKDSTACLAQLVEALDKLGTTQGAVLTYAPYISILLSDDPFKNG